MHPFELENPTTLEDVVRSLARGQGEARLLAGGQDLLTELKEHLDEPERLVNLKHVPALDRVEWGPDGSLEVGALVTLQALADEPRLRRSMSALAESAASVASPQIRAFGTLGGNLNQRPRCWYFRDENAVCLKKGGSECFAYGGRNKYNAILGGGPSYIVHPSDVAPALVALGAEATLVGPDGERSVALADYYTLPSEGDVRRETVLAPHEVLRSVRVPAPAPGLRSTYLKFRERGSYDFALSAVAVALQLTEGRVAAARIVLGGVAPRPWPAVAAQEQLLGRALDAETIAAASHAAVLGAQPLSDNAYKVPLTRGLVTRALESLRA